MTPALDPDIETKIRDSFARQSMMATIGAQITALQSGHITLTAPVSDHVSQQQGFAHGGLIFTLADSAAGYAALSMLPLDMEVMTAELKINFLAPASQTIIAEGRVLKPGKRLTVVAADVWDVSQDGTRKHVAALQGTMISVPS